MKDKTSDASNEELENCKELESEIDIIDEELTETEKKQMEDDLGDFIPGVLDSVLNNKVFTREEENEIFSKYKETSDPELRDIIVEHNIKLVYHIAKNYNSLTGISMEFADFIQEGCIGLIKAIDKFDPDKGFKFSTYAIWWIKQAITRAINDTGSTVRVPVHISEKLQKINKFKAEFQNKNDRLPTEEEIKSEEIVIDPDAEVDVFDISEYDAFDNNGKTQIDIILHEKEIKEEKDTEKKLGKKQIIVLENSKTPFTVLLDLVISETGIEIDSPFSESISIWLTSRLNSAVKSEKYPELTAHYEEIKDLYFPAQKEDKKWEEKYVVKDRASQMTYFGAAYRILNNGDNIGAKKLLCEADEYLLAKHSSYFNTIRQYLESLVYPLRSWDYSRRENYTYTMYCNELEIACKEIGVEPRPLMSMVNFNNWKSMKKRPDRSDEPSLKPDLAELLMTYSEITKIRSFYPELLNDVFSLFGETSSGSHYRPNKYSTVKFEKAANEDIPKIEKITLVLEEIYEVKNNVKTKTQE